MATDRQVSYITALVSRSAYASNIEAIDAYGLGLRAARDLSEREASELIDWLLGKPHHAPTVAPAPAATVDSVGREVVVHGMRGVVVEQKTTTRGKKSKTLMLVTVAGKNYGWVESVNVDLV